MKKYITIISILLIMPVLGFAFELPAGPAWTTQRITQLLDNIASFLIWAGVAGAVIAIVYAGILYFTSGFSTKAVDNAKGILKNAIIGVALVVGFGVIINTVTALITGNFFNSGTSNNPNTQNSNPKTKYGGAGEPCANNQLCNANLELTCKTYQSGTICVRAGGNLTAEGCKDNDDCKIGLICQTYQKVCVPE